MKRLKDENERLTQENKEYRTRSIEVSNIRHQLEIEKKDLLKQVKREHLSSLLEPFNVILYKVGHHSVPGPKCDKCDEHRELYFKSPRGGDYWEACECDIEYTQYHTVPHICTEFKLSESGNLIYTWYTSAPEYKDVYKYGCDTEFLKNLYNPEMKYEDLDRYDTFFKNEEDCKKYCDWLSEKSKNEFETNAPEPPSPSRAKSRKRR
jgi:hypothetical protein